MKIALASDHAGATALTELQAYLSELGHEPTVYGPEEHQEDDDYPDYIFPAAKAVASGTCQAGIILGGSGQGEAMAANRVHGVRCAVFYGPAIATGAVDAEGDTSQDPYAIIKLSRQHNNANMLSLASRFVALEQMKQAINMWLNTPFSDQDRHARRNQKLDET